MSCVIHSQAVVKVDFQRVPETEELVACGHLLNQVGTTFVVIGEVNNSGQAIDEGSIICLENRSVIGRVEEVGASYVLACNSVGVGT